MKFITDLLYILGFILFTALVTIALSKISTPIESPAEKIEREFKIVCTESGGKTAWNRQNWVCIK